VRLGTKSFDSEAATIAAKYLKSLEVLFSADPPQNISLFALFALALPV